jgi:hypothetical protein
LPTGSTSPCISNVNSSFYALLRDSEEEEEEEDAKVRRKQNGKFTKSTSSDMYSGNP